MAGVIGAEALQAIWEESRDEVLVQVDLVADAVTDALTGSLTDERRLRAAGEAHKLAGSVGSFGFRDASRYARELEHALKSPETMAAAHVPDLAERVVELRRALSQPDAPGATGAAAAVTGPPAVMFVADAALGSRLRDEALRRGIDAPVAGELAVARTMTSAGWPDVVVLDLDVEGDRAAALAFLAETSAETAVIALAMAPEEIDRVEVARRGARAFLAGPPAPGAVVAAALELRERVAVGGARLLAVDDDPVFLAALRAVLEGEGLRVETCDGPPGFFERLEQAAPDLVVLDYEMPHASGAELCRSMRNDPRWAGIPVVFVSSRTDREAVGAMFAAGADDYLTKPLVGAEAVARIRNRLERTRLQRACAQRNGLASAPQLVDVLVVEDDPVLARLLVHALETRGYRSHLIDDGALAVEALAAAAPTVAARVLLLDWSLPGLDGLRVLRTLRERGVLAHTRVIMLTARGTEREVLEALQAGAVDHVTKPFSVPVLMERVSRSLER